MHKLLLDFHPFDFDAYWLREYSKITCYPLIIGYSGLHSGYSIPTQELKNLTYYPAYLEWGRLLKARDLDKINHDLVSKLLPYATEEVRARIFKAWIKEISISKYELTADAKQIVTRWINQIEFDSASIIGKLWISFWRAYFHEFKIQSILSNGAPHGGPDFFALAAARSLELEYTTIIGSGCNAKFIYNLTTGKQISLVEYKKSIDSESKEELIDYYAFIARCRLSGNTNNIPYTAETLKSLKKATKLEYSNLYIQCIKEGGKSLLAYYESLKRKYNSIAVEASSIIKEHTNNGRECYKAIYFPLHLQPEATTAPLAGKWADQYQAILHLKYLFGEYSTIIAKEHPWQFRMASNFPDYCTARALISEQIRPIDFYQNAIKATPNLRWLSLNEGLVSIKDLDPIVISLTGTQAIEAFLNGFQVYQMPDCMGPYNKLLARHGMQKDSIKTRIKLTKEYFHNYSLDLQELTCVTNKESHEYLIETGTFKRLQVKSKKALAEIFAKIK